MTGLNLTLPGVGLVPGEETARNVYIYPSFELDDGAATFATNDYIYPSFETASGTVTIRTNLYKYTNAELGDTTGWTLRTGATISASTDQVMPGGTYSYKCVTPGSALDEGIQPISSNNAAQSGTTGIEMHSIWVFAPNGALLQAQLHERTTADGFVATRGVTNFTGTGAWQRISVSGSKATAANVMSIRVSTRVSNQAITFYVVNALAEALAILLDYFDGNTTDAGDFSYQFTGTTNASTSTMTAPGMAGVSAGTERAVFQSSQWAREGSKSLRIKAFSVAGGVNGAVVVGGVNTFGSLGFAAGDVVTVVAVCRLTEPQTGSINAQARAIRHVGPGSVVTYEQAPNTAGEHVVRLTVTIGNATTDQLRLSHGADATNADIWWDLLAIVKRPLTEVGVLGTNLANYPNAESGGTTGWVARLSATLNNVTSQFHSGARSISVATPGSVTNEGGVYLLNGSSGLTGDHRASIWVLAPNGALLNMEISERDPVNAGVGATTNITFTGTGAWQRISGVKSISSAANHIGVAVATRTSAQAITFYLDDVLVEAGSTLHDYYDGSTPPSGSTRYRWTGTTNASTSEKYQVSWDEYTGPPFSGDTVLTDFTFEWSSTPDASSSTMNYVTLPGITNGLQSEDWAYEGDYSLRVFDDEVETFSLDEPSTVVVVARGAGQELVVDGGAAIVSTGSDEVLRGFGGTDFTLGEGYWDLLTVVED